MSAAAKTASAPGSTSAPAVLYASSDAPMPLPAPVSTLTLCPCPMISRTDDGVRPTRYSWFLISFGTPCLQRNYLIYAIRQRLTQTREPPAREGLADANARRLRRMHRNGCVREA